MGKINLDNNRPMTFVPSKSLVRGAGISQVVKNPPANAGDIRDGVCSLGQEDLLEEGTETHPSLLDWRIPVDRGAWQTTAHRVAKSRTQLKRLSTAQEEYGDDNSVSSSEHCPVYLVLALDTFHAFLQLPSKAGSLVLSLLMRRLRVDICL